MNNTKKIIIITILVILATLVGISKRKANDIVIAPTATSTDVVVNESTDFYSIKAEIPTEPKDKDNIMFTTATDIINNKKEQWKIGGALYNEEQNISTQYPDRPAVKYELDIQYDKFESETKGTVSYVFKNYEFTGGAHGGTGLKTYTFDSNGLVDLATILNFTSENKVAMTRLIESKLKVQLGELHNEQMLSEGLGLAYLKADGTFDKTKSDGFDFRSNFDNFAILDGGIKFIFGQYQVGPYAAGMQEVMLSWEELGPYLVK